jgi:hypothetical protein
MENLENYFDELLLSTGRDGMDKLISYLHTTDFFTAPASTRFHSCHEGGLLKHTLNVYKTLRNKYNNEDIWGTLEHKESTLIIVALLHDICKANFYKVDYRNAKNENGVWEKVPYYTVDDCLPYGHGEKSVYIASGFIKLTREEAMAIRWHMGFSEAKENYNALGKAISEFSLILALSESDLEATYLLEEEK